MSVTVYIVRHGNTFDKGDVVTRVGARTDLPLSSSGQIQATKLAAHFANMGAQFSHVFSSPLQRTQQTTDAIVAAQAAPNPVEFLEFLREVDYGPDENKPEQDVVDRIGQDALNLWESDAIVPDGWVLDTEALVTSWKAHFERIAQTSDQTGPVLIVTSNGIARFALQIAKAEPSTTYPLKLSTGAYGILEIAKSGDVTVRDWNVRP